jgi:hypothetical protein
MSIGHHIRRTAALAYEAIATGTSRPQELRSTVLATGNAGSGASIRRILE